VSSIRPLATITVLAAVGVFLYMKINETEPPLPAGVEDWSATTELEFDMDGTAPTAGPQFGMPSAESEASGYSEAQAYSEAPGYSADIASAAPAFDAGASTAPTWSEPPSDSAPPAAVAAGSVLDEANGDDTSIGAPQLPDLPPLPSLPPAASTAPSAEGIAQRTLPDVPQNLSLPATLPQAQSSLFSATRLAVQAALDRGELSQALLLLSDWYGDPSLTPSETTEVNTLLGELAGSVIYSTEHRLEPPYMVQAGERLEAIAKEYEVPWQLLAKINGITSADQLQPGQQLKVVRGPFSALIDISQRKMTLMLDRRYAGRFSLNLDPSITVEEGHWEVNQKLLTPANVSLPGAGPTTPTEERSLMLSNSHGGATQVAILRGTMASNSAADPPGRVLKLNPTDAADVFDILSLGSKVVIRR